MAMFGDGGPVFHLEPLGRLGNLMIQYMVALTFRDLVPGCQVSGISIPEWGIRHPRIESPGPVAVERQEQHIDLPGLAELVRSGAIKRIDWSGFGQRMENFLPPERYRSVFVSPFKQPVGFGADYLVCPVRAEEIVDGAVYDYPLTPVEFYRDIVDLTGLTPVFIGQTQPNAYVDRLRAAFPAARFREPQADVLVDFETIRQSKNVVVGVSSYMWLAAWLSREAENIYMAVSGLFNPIQRPNVDLLPYGDKRFKFFLFPINYGVPLKLHADAHRRMAPYWRQMPHEVLRGQFRDAPRVERNLDLMLECFDEAFYMAAYADVAAVGKDVPGFGRMHYLNHGFEERRAPMRLDRAWYAGQYPLAAFEIAQGDYVEFEHHYMAAGRARAYLPNPPEGALAVGQAETLRKDTEHRSSPARGFGFLPWRR
jgi:hypothetical protein